MAQARRLELDAILRALLGSTNVYFQAPPSTGMVYPCILYQRDNTHTDFADNVPYSSKQRYQLTVIDRDPDSDIPGKVKLLPMCLNERFFVADNLNHDVFTIYF